MPDKTAFLFPGQGSQKVGMGLELCETFPDVKARFFDRADELLGFSLSELCFQGPEPELTRTENAQPALLLVSIAALEALRRHGHQPNAVAGHSEVSLKLGHSGSEGKVLVFRCCRLRFAGGAGGFAGIFLKAVFR